MLLLGRWLGLRRRWPHPDGRGTGSRLFLPALTRDERVQRGVPRPRLQLRQHPVLLLGGRMALLRLGSAANPVVPARGAEPGGLVLRHAGPDPELHVRVDHLRLRPHPDGSAMVVHLR